MLFGKHCLFGYCFDWENGINSIGLGNGAGVVIGQVEPLRPGDASAGDDLAHRNTTTDPAQVFVYDGFHPPDSTSVGDHPQEVAGVMISTDMTDGTGELMNGIAPTGVAPGASLYSAAFITEGTGLGYQDAILTFQYIASIAGMRAVNHSWGKASDGSPFDGSSLLTLAFDWSVTRHNVLHIIAGNQGNETPTSCTSRLPTHEATRIGGPVPRIEAQMPVLSVDGGRVNATANCQMVCPARIAKAIR